MKYSLWEALLALPATYPGLYDLEGDMPYLMGCRDLKQFGSTLRGLLDPEQFCPFCRTELAREQPCEETSSWYLKKNDFPQDGLLAMFLIVPHRHITTPQELTDSDWVQVGELFKKAICNVPGGGLSFRFGDPRHTAGTMPHIHFNIFSPTGEKEYRVPFSKTPEEREINYSRLKTLIKETNEKGGLSWLFSTEGSDFLRT